MLTQELGRLFRHSSVYAIGNALERFGGFLLLPVFTRHLSLEEFGAVELFYSISAVISGVLSTGVVHASLRFYFEYDDEQARRKVISTCLILVVLLGGGGSALLALAHRELTELFFGSHEYGRAFLVMLATLVLSLSSQVCTAYLRAREYSLLYIGVSLSKLVLQVTASTWLVVHLHKGVEGVLIGNALAVFLGWSVLAAFTVRECGLHFDRHVVRPILRYSLPLLPMTVAALITTRLDRFLIMSFLSLEALGIYSLALKLSSLLEQLIGVPFSTAYGSFRFSIMKDDHASEIQARVVRYLFLAAVAVGVGIVLLTDDALRLIADPHYWPAARILPSLVLAGILNVMAYPAQTGILFAKKTTHLLQVTLITGVITLAVNLLLLTWVGLSGAALAQLGASATGLLLTNHFSQRYLTVNYGYRRFVTVMGLASAACLLGLPFAGLHASIAVPAHLAVFAGFAVAVMNVGFLDEEELTWLRARTSWLVNRKESS